MSLLLFVLILFIIYAAQATLLFFLFWLLIGLIARYAGFIYIPRKGRWVWSAMIGMATAPYGAVDVGHAPVYLTMGTRLMLNSLGSEQVYHFSNAFVWIIFAGIIMLISDRVFRHYFL